MGTADTTHGRRKTISILGSTGSVGCSTIDLIRRDPGSYRVEALTAHRNVALLAEQARSLDAACAVIADGGLYGDLQRALAGTDTEVGAGPEAVAEAASRPADWIMAAIVGAAGLVPTLEGIRQGSTVALANKESLVCAGEVMLAAVAESGAVLLPVDSEHNAIFQVFDSERRQGIEKITLTASGGPFRDMSVEEMSDVTPAAAVAHPNWDMGAKISVDSATMMNKGLELIEAHYLFAMPEDRIDILVHPQSIIHSMVSYIDGSVLAQLGTPDMRTPIAYALGWPERIPAPSERLELGEIATLTFEAPDPMRFPALRLAREALTAGQSCPTVLNAANETAVEGFLAGRLGFLDVARIVEETLSGIPRSPVRSIDDVIAVDLEARAYAAGVVSAPRTLITSD